MITRIDLEAAEVAGYRDLCAVAPEGLGVADADDGGTHAMVTTTHPSQRMLNHAIGPPTPAIDAFFADHATPAAYGARTAPGDGWERISAWMKFARGTEPPARVACALEIAPVTDAAALGALAATAFGLRPEAAAWFARLVGRDGWHVLGAHDDGALVATGSLWVHEGVGWCTWGATSASHRGRGAQAALLGARIALARELGLDGLVTETGLPEGPSYRNIRTAGFSEAYLRPFWTRRAPGGSAPR